MHDVLVAGASLAGATTAIHLARQGLSVRLIDKGQFPRRKCCGEGLFSRGVAELRDIGVLPEIEAQAGTLSAVRFSIQGCSAEARLGQGAIGVQRSLLDDAVLRACAAAGVEVELGVEARRLVETADGFAVEIGSETVGARVLIAADGIRSGLRTQAGLDRPARRRRYGVSAHLLLAEEPPPRVEVYFEQGYALYVTPVGGRLVNAAVLLERRGMEAMAGRLAEGFLDLVGRSALGRAFELVDEPLAAGPFPASAKALWRSPNLVLVGDAAGFHDGISGDGMSLALISARYCAGAVVSFLNTGSPRPFREYEQRRRRLARNSRLIASLILALASRPSLGRRAVLNLARKPDTFAKLAAINGGKLGLGSLRPRDIMALALGV